MHETGVGAETLVSQPGLGLQFRLQPQKTASDGRSGSGTLFRRAALARLIEKGEIPIHVEAAARVHSIPADSESEMRT